MKIATWNLNGVRARHRELTELAAVHAPDILCLQEIKAAPAQVPEPLTGLPQYHSYWHGNARGYSGVSIHLRRELTASPRFSIPDFDVDNRALRVEHGALAVLSLYVPNGGRDYPAKLDFLRALHAFAAAAHRAGQLLVMCGDLNITRGDADVHPRQRKPGAIGQRPDERALLEAVLGESLVDLGRALHPDDDQLFTWWPPWRGEKSRNHGWRIDYIVASAALGGRTRSVEVLRDFGSSDHAPVIADIDWP
jgi:exodeoxyribonuclease-3